MDNIFSSEATSLSSLVIIELEIKHSSFVTWPPEQMIKVSWHFAGGDLLP